MVKIVLEVPDELRGVAEAMASTLAGLQGTLARTGGGKAIDYARVESEVSERTAGIERATHRAILQTLDIDVPAVMIGGIRYNRVGRCEASYHTLAGSVSIERSLYRQSGQRGGQPGARVVDPVSLRAGVVGDGWLPRTARVMTHAVQQGTSREAEASAVEYGRLPYARSSFERVAHLVGALAVAGHQDIEDALIDAYEVPVEARSVSVSLDRVSVPMEEPRTRPVGRPKKGAPKKPVERNFRMAYCATVTLHDENSVALHTIRYGCMPQGDVIGLRDRLVADVATLGSKHPGLKIQLLCDGAPEMWNLLEEGFTEQKFGQEIYRLVDLYHLTEKLGAAARVIDGPSAAAETLSRWKLSLLNRPSASEDILEELFASGMEDAPVGETEPVHAAITYLQTHSEDAERMNYARARRLGLPLGSGNVEATCKSLFEVRLKRCGSRWKEVTGQHIVQLRALALSDRWGPAIELTLRPLRSAVRAA
ncbi:MAG: ISKra4-like element ISMfu2 family transposase [bacterium]